MSVSAPPVPPDDRFPRPGRPASRLAKAAVGFGRMALVTANSMLDLVLLTVWVCLLSALVAAGIGTLIVYIGLPILAFTVQAERWFTMVERRRAEAVHDIRLSTPPRARTTKKGIVGFLAQAWLDVRAASFWRGLLHHGLGLILATLTATVLFLGVGGGLALLLSWIIPQQVRDHTDRSALNQLWLPRLDPLPSAALGLIHLAVSLGTLFALAVLHRTAARSLLGVDPEVLLQRQLATTTTQRDQAVSASDVERRRIERDLHDGVQPQLVNVGMMLSMARTKLDSDPAGARQLLDEAHASTRSAIEDLRQIARGIHPAILSELGLDPALTGLVARSAVPSTLDVDVPRRCAPAAETAVYFAVAECLANVAKHSAATQCSVHVQLVEPNDLGPARIEAQVRDNGHGGARLTPDGGLAGLQSRLHAIGGTLRVSSDGTGTTVTAVAPCAS